MACLWCGADFEPRATGGKPQRFCQPVCRRAFDAACRLYAASEVEAGRLPVSSLRLALEQRARCLGRDMGSEDNRTSAEARAVLRAVVS